MQNAWHIIYIQQMFTNILKQNAFDFNIKINTVFVSFFLRHFIF